MTRSSSISPARASGVFCQWDLLAAAALSTDLMIAGDPMAARTISSSTPRGSRDRQKFFMTARREYPVHAVERRASCVAGHPPRRHRARRASWSPPGPAQEAHGARSDTGSGGSCTPSHRRALRCLPDLDGLRRAEIVVDFGSTYGTTGSTRTTPRGRRLSQPPAAAGAIVVGNVN